SNANNADEDFNISLDLRNSAFSRLSLRISACSVLVTPGRCPSSISALRRHRRTDSCDTPSLLATDLMASNSETSESSIVVSNNRSARSRNSGEYLRGMFLILLYGSEQNLGYFTRARWRCRWPAKTGVEW